MPFLRRREPNIMKMKNMKTVIFIKELHFGRPMSISSGSLLGRGHETYGEDPTLIAILGVAYIKGLQERENICARQRVPSILQYIPARRKNATILMQRLA